MSVKTRFSEVIIEVIEKYGLSNAKVGRKTGFQTNVIDEHRRGVRKNPDVELIREFCNKYNVNPNWVLLGNGDKYINKGEAPEPAPIYNKDKEPDSPRVTAPEPEYDSHGAREPHKLSRPDHELIGRVYELLGSPSDFRDSIISAIHTIYDASIIKRRLDKIEGEMAEFKTICSVLADRTERRCAEKDEKIRDYDPPEKKEDLLKLRKSMLY